MVNPEPVQRLAEVLLRRTTARRIQWKVPAGSDGTWLIYNSKDAGSVDVRRARNIGGGWTYVLRVFNPEGVIVDSYSWGDVQRPEDGAVLRELYEAAAAQVGVMPDATVKRLLDELGEES